MSVKKKTVVKKKASKKIVAKKKVVKFPYNLKAGDTAFVARKTQTAASVGWIDEMNPAYKRNIKIIGWSFHAPECVVAAFGTDEFLFHCKDLNRSSK